MELEYKGASIFYTDTGKGSVLVLLHGFLENSSIWQPFISPLSKTHRVLCIDLLGHGKTGCLGYIHSMEMMAEAVDAVLQHLNISHYTIFGHSMGGYVALALAENQPESIKGLCLVNSTAAHDSDEKKLNRDRAIAAVKENHKTFIRIAIINLFRPKNRKAFSKDIEELIQQAFNTPLQGIIAALEGMKIRKNRENLFRTGSFKKMIIVGKHDPVLEVQTLLQQSEGSNANIAILPDGHMSFIENREELLQNIVYFIE